MILSEEDACKKVCIHERKITDTGLCVAGGCMYWEGYTVKDMGQINQRRAQFDSPPIELKRGVLMYGECRLLAKK